MGERFFDKYKMTARFVDSNRKKRRVGDVTPYGVILNLRYTYNN